MLLTRRFLISLLALAVGLSVTRIVTTSSDAQRLKLDLAEIDDIKYGLLDVDLWIEHLLVVMDAQIETLGETPDQREAVRAAFETVIHQLITEVETTIRRQNEERPFASLRQLATDFVVDFDELRDRSGEFAAIAVEEIERPENKDRLKIYLRERVNAFADSALVRTDRSGLEAVLTRRVCGDRDDCRAKMTSELAERNAVLARLAILAIVLTALTIAASTWPRRGFGIVELSAILVGVFALLLGGLLTPMIDIKAEILRLDLEVVGETISFRNQVLFYQSKSIIDVVELLIRTRRPDLVLVGIGLVTFSVVFPAIKLLATFVYWHSARLRERATVRFFALESAKWSMADVFVIALFLAFLGFDGLTGNQLASLMTDSPYVDVQTQNGTQLRVGFHLFAAFCLAGLAVSTMVKRSNGLGADVGQSLPSEDGD